MAEQPNDNYAKHDHNHDGIYTPIPTFEEHAADPAIHGAYTSVPDYSQTQNISGFPYTCTKSGIVYLSWSIDTRICVVPTINGRRIMAFGEGNTEGGYTSTIAVSKDDVLDMLYINSSGVHDSTFQPNMGDIQDSSDLASFTAGAKYQTIYARFVPYKHQADATAGGVFNNVYNNMPVGSVCWFKLNAAPDGWVVCNGKWYSEDGKYSSENYTEVCTIQTPNLIGRYALGATSDIGDTVEASIPNIKGTFIAQTPYNGSSTGYSGAFTPDMDSYIHINDSGSGPYSRNITFNAGSSSSVYKDSATTVTPPSTKLLPCMKIYNNDDNVYMPVPDYGQTQSIMEFPHTCTKSGVVYLSWSIDYSYCVIPTVNGKRIMAFADAGTAGGYTSTFVVSSGDVIDLTIITNYNGTTTDDKPKLLDINGAGELQEGGSMAYITGSYNYVMYARFVPYKNQQLKVSDDVEVLSPIDYSKAIDVLDQYTVDTQGTLSNNGWSATGKGRVLVQSPTISGTAYGLFIKPFNSNKYIKLWQTDGAGPVNMFIHVSDGDNIGIRSLNDTNKTYSAKPVILTFFPND